MNDFINDFVNNLHRDETPNREMPSSATHMINCDIPTTLYHELITMAEIYDRDPKRLAGNLLTLAINEALEQMPKNDREQIEQLTLKHEMQEIKKMEDNARFNVGGT